MMSMTYTYQNPRVFYHLDGSMWRETCEYYIEISDSVGVIVQILIQNMINGINALHRSNF